MKPKIVNYTVAIAVGPNPSALSVAISAGLILRFRPRYFPAAFALAMPSALI